MNKKIVMNKQQYIPCQARKTPLYELQSVDDLETSLLYAVKINGEEKKVYGNEFFHFVNPVVDKIKDTVLRIEVAVKKPFEHVCIRPQNVQIPVARDGERISFSLPADQKIVVELDEDLLCPLYILPSEKIERPERVTYDFQKGKAYNIGCLELQSGDVVYLEEGTVVSGRIHSRMASHIKIIGNGILYGGNWHEWDKNSGEQLIVPVLGDDIEIRGINLLDGGSWHIVPTACRNVRVENVNIMGKVITGDGLDIVGCEHVVVRGCFIRANDDCISIKAVEFQDPSGCADVRHVLVENCLFWNAEFGNVLEIGYETRCDEITDVVFRNCEILHCEYEGNQSGGVLTIHNADRAFVHDIHYENIRIEDAQEKFIDIKTLDSKYSRDRKRGMISDIWFSDIEITEGIFPVSIVRGFEMTDEICRPHNFHFDNITICGQKVSSVNELRMVKELSDGFYFQ